MVLSPVLRYLFSRKIMKKAVEEITNLLIENNIVSRQHDEGQDQNPGAYGAITGIAIFVFEKDYEKSC